MKARLGVSTHNAKPVMSKNNDMRGNVRRRRFLRPNVSMVYTARSAITKFRAQKPPRCEQSLDLGEVGLREYGR
jgi:hypothetical protein